MSNGFNITILLDPKEIVVYRVIVNVKGLNKQNVNNYFKINNFGCTLGFITRGCYFKTLVMNELLTLLSIDDFDSIMQN